MTLRNYSELAVLLVIGLIAAACSMGAAKVSIFPDRSGTAQFSEMVFDFGDSEIKGKDFKGIRRSQIVHMSIKSKSYEFEDASKAILGGITLKVAEKGELLEIDATIPLSKESGWYRAMNITEEKQKSMVRFMKVFQKAMGGKGPMPAPSVKDIAELMKVNVSFLGPGNIKSAKIIAPAGVPDWFAGGKKKDASASPMDAKKPNEARLAIPLDVLLAGKYPQITIRVVADKKPLPDTIKEWEKFKKKEDILGPMGGMPGM